MLKRRTKMIELRKPAIDLCGGYLFRMLTKLVEKIFQCLSGFFNPAQPHRLGISFQTMCMAKQVIDQTAARRRRVDGFEIEKPFLQSAQMLARFFAEDFEYRVVQHT